MDNHLSDNQMETVLQHNVIGHLGCSLGDLPYVVPMCYAYDGTNIYGRTYEGLKLDMLRNNPKVCFQVADIENMINWKSVVCRGEFKELTGREEQHKAILTLQKRVSAMIDSEALRHSLYWPFSLEDADDIKGVLFCIVITSKTGRFHPRSLEYTGDQI